MNGEWWIEDYRFGGSYHAADATVKLEDSPGFVSAAIGLWLWLWRSRHSRRCWLESLLCFCYIYYVCLYKFLKLAFIRSNFLRIVFQIIKTIKNFFLKTFLFDYYIIILKKFKQHLIKKRTKTYEVLILLYNSAWLFFIQMKLKVSFLLISNFQTLQQKCKNKFLRKSSFRKKIYWCTKKKKGKHFYFCKFFHVTLNLFSLIKS